MRKRGLEPLRGDPHYHLKVARIPIPPLSHIGKHHLIKQSISIQLLLHTKSKKLFHLPPKALWQGQIG